jgi:hypothetical protein
MPGSSVAPPSPSTPQVVLSRKEWDEIEDSVIALHAAIDAGVHDEGEELLKAVYLRLESALKPVRERIGD